MTTTYTISRNEQYNSYEVTFDSKPATAVLDALKALKMRWNHKKGCWYGFATESAIKDAIINNSENGETVTGEPVEGATVYTDGYLGGGAVYGSKSNRHLYGSDLAKAIRADLKAAGIKGVTIASKNGNIQATITTTSADVVPELEFVANYRELDAVAFDWIEYTDETGISRSVHMQEIGNLPDDLRESIRLENAYRDYARDYARPASINHYHLDKYIGFTPAGLERIRKVLHVIEDYRFDESNSMVDYFHTNFYISLYTKPASK